MNYPDEMTPAVRSVLEQPCFYFINAANVWRAAGEKIGQRAEDEQSYFLHLQLKLALQHGDDWRDEFNKLGMAMYEKAQANIAAGKEDRR